ncbi:hypothetical protein E2C01_008192 [Portunus trituberculatus]|uniref:Uncharacterized protein n=1 Tax=Portunus trituberculatus TaxID=210409 RepID=A0A5B7D586_PORTR|nr:hypothetical protein [Portunus trituberculatus]
MVCLMSRMNRFFFNSEVKILSVVISVPVLVSLLLPEVVLHLLDLILQSANFLFVVFGLIHKLFTQLLRRLQLGPQVLGIYRPELCEVGEERDKGHGVLKDRGAFLRYLAGGQWRNYPRDSCGNFINSRNNDRRQGRGTFISGRKFAFVRVCDVRALRQAARNIGTHLLYHEDFLSSVLASALAREMISAERYCVPDAITASSPPQPPAGAGATGAAETVATTTHTTTRKTMTGERGTELGAAGRSIHADHYRV